MGRDNLYALVTRAYPYRDLSRNTPLNGRCAASRRADPHQRPRPGRAPSADRVNRRLRARKGARLTAPSTTAGRSARPMSSASCWSPEVTVVGTVDEEFGVESSRGGHLPARQHIVADSGPAGERPDRPATRTGAPPTIPFWRGEGAGRTVELSGGGLPPADRNRRTHKQPRRAVTRRGAHFMSTAKHAAGYSWMPTSQPAQDLRRVVECDHLYAAGKRLAWAGLRRDYPTPLTKSWNSMASVS